MCYNSYLFVMPRLSQGQKQTNRGDHCLFVLAPRTGRDVPEHLIVASLQAMDKSLNTLTPLCDFVARINNEGNEPSLVAFETVDTKGNWRVISDRFARTYHDPSEFPQHLPELKIKPLECRSLIAAGQKDSQKDSRTFKDATVPLYLFLFIVFCLSLYNRNKKKQKKNKGAAFSSSGDSGSIRSVRILGRMRGECGHTSSGRDLRVLHQFGHLESV